MRIVFNTSTCASVGMCEAAAPDFFEIAPTGELKVLNDHPAECHRAPIKQAIAECPTGSLRLED